MARWPIRRRHWACDVDTGRRGRQHARVRRIARTLRRAARRAVDDPHVLLAIGLAVPTSSSTSSSRQAASAAVVVLTLAFVVAMVLSVLRRAMVPIGGWLGPPAPARARGAVRDGRGQPDGDASFRPLLALYVPVVTMAAAYSARAAWLIGGFAGISYLGGAMATGEHVDNAIQRGLVLAAVSIVLIVGTRRTVSSLEQTLARLRQTMSDSRRRSRQVEAVEAVGRALAARGPEKDTLDQVMDLLHRRSWLHPRLALPRRRRHAPARRPARLCRADPVLRRQHRGHRPRVSQPPGRAGNRHRPRSRLPRPRPRGDQRDLRAVARQGTTCSGSSTSRPPTTGSTRPTSVRSCSSPTGWPPPWPWLASDGRWPSGPISSSD